MVELNANALAAAKIARAAAMDMLADGIQWRLDPRYIIALCDVVEGSALPAPDDGLVERLRYRVENPSAWDSFDQGGSDLCREAAAALQTKDEQNERLKYERDVWHSKSQMHQKAAVGLTIAEQQVQKLTAENERLREVLNLIDALDPEGQIYGVSPDACRGLIARMGNIARSALTQEGER